MQTTKSIPISQDSRQLQYLWHTDLLLDAGRVDVEKSQEMVSLRCHSPRAHHPVLTEMSLTLKAGCSLLLNTGEGQGEPTPFFPCSVSAQRCLNLGDSACCSRAGTKLISLSIQRSGNFTKKSVSDTSEVLTSVCHFISLFLAWLLCSPRAYSCRASMLQPLHCMPHGA